MEHLPETICVVFHLLNSLRKPGRSEMYDLFWFAVTWIYISIALIFLEEIISVNEMDIVTNICDILGLRTKGIKM